jgi:RNA polymerase sigma factor (sigma-70 family)
MSQSMDPHEFRHFLRGLQGRRSDAYQLLVNRYVPFMKAVARPSLSRRAPHLHLDSDVAQETLVDVFQAIETGQFWDDEERFCGCMRTVTRARAVDAARHLASGLRVEPDEAVIATALSPDPSPESQASANEVRARMLEWMPALTARCLQLSWDGYTVAEIAALTGRHQRTVRKKLAKARQIMHKRLDGDSGSEAG